MDGLWTVEFGTNAGSFGGGVAVFRDGTVLGGDGTYYYVGRYKFEGNTFKAEVKSAPFIEGAVSIFKTVGRELTLELAGTLTDESHAIANGYLRGMPSLKFGAKLTKRG
jgi:T3SS negative regulator,GrlR